LGGTRLGETTPILERRGTQEHHHEWRSSHARRHPGLETPNQETGGTVAVPLRRVRRILEGVLTTEYGSLLPAGHVVFKDER
jgi:hypothetical protein